MAQELKRKLTAILSADVKGYSRLMGEDEEWTVRTLDTFKGVMKNIIPQHRGRVVDSTGDNLLAEFASVVDAVQAAVEIQQVLRAKNSLLPENRRMEFRIGVNLGDVIEEGDRIFGDGVNIAARLEGLAEPGGICISGSAFEQIENKLPLHYDFLGEHAVKNIARPVRVYRALMDNGVVKEKAARPKGHGAGRKVAVFSLVAALVIIASVALWQFVLRPTPPSHPPVEKAEPQKMAYALPDKPSIAVLPFVNMSDDPQQEYFSDGMTEDLITDLSKISGLFVIARNSTFVYKGKSVKIRQVAEELGVRYVLEGSVRRAGDQVRVNAQLIDATTGQHLWAERYDGSMKDVFSLQDKINQKIATALAVKLTAGEKALLTQKGTNDPAVYEEFIKGREHYLRFTKDDLAKAEACFKRAIELDPSFGQAQAALALLYFEGTNNRMEEAFKINYEVARLRARQHLREAMKKPTSISYQVAGVMDLNLRHWDAAISQLEAAVTLDPSDSACHDAMSWVLSMSGRPAEGMEYAKRGMRLDPLNPARYLGHIGIAHFCMGEWKEAVTAIEKAMKLNPELEPPVAFLASAYAHLGRNEEAKAAYQTYYQWLSRNVAVQRWEMYKWPFKDRRVEGSFVEGLIKAGFPSSRLVSVHVSKEDQLTGDDLRALLFPSTFTGFVPGDWSSEITKDGIVTLRAPWVTGGVDTGRVWLEGDKQWTQFQNFWYGMAHCATVFKNPKGTAETKDEYIRFNDLYYGKFSRVR
jgi:adenylate cyclase